MRCKNKAPLLLGLGCVLAMGMIFYPMASNWLSGQSRSQVITEYETAVEVLDNLEDAILRVQRSYTARELEPFLQTDASFRTFGRLQDSLYFNTLAVNCMQTLQEMHELADQPPT